MKGLYTVDILLHLHADEYRVARKFSCSIDNEQPVEPLGDPFAALRSRVTSKRGTTEAALTVLDAKGTPQAIHDAVRAAYERAGELSHELSGQPG